MQDFKTLGVDPLLASFLARLKITAPTEVQAGTIVAAISGRDIVAVAPTGTGKTLAYLLPIATRLRADRPTEDNRHFTDPRARLRAIVLAPTRELAQQIGKEATQLLGGTVLRCAVVWGKSSIAAQAAALKAGVDVLVGTPGRVRELLEIDACSLAWIQMVVIDEADRMLDMGFAPQVRALMERVPAQRQTYLFTATLRPAVESLAGEIVREPFRYGGSSTAARTVPTAYDCRDAAKTPLLLHLLKDPKRTGVLVFTRTRRRAGWVATALRRNDIPTGLLHGDRSQKQREAALDGLRTGENRVLVATDVAARGLHVPAIRCVVNYDLPPMDDDVIHRIGRAGHASDFAESFVFVDTQDRTRWERVAQALEIPPDLLPDPEAARLAPRKRGAHAAGPAGKSEATGVNRPLRRSTKVILALRGRLKVEKTTRENAAVRKGRLRGKQSNKPINPKSAVGKGIRPGPGGR
ncbi:MAG: DEAD/DEAH box helicase [Planctomycetes bacterium]|nr:DEAD/DEAH box helicase [Planctomycetota bacterium]